MLIYSIIAVFSVVILSPGFFRNPRTALKISFFTLFLFSALRYNYGNDYQSYQLIFESHKDLEFENINDAFSYFYEPGWIMLNQFLREGGFFSIVILVSALNAVIYYSFFTKYLKPQLFAYGMFIYLFSPTFYLINLSAMRQSVAAIFFIKSIDYIISRRPIHFTVAVVAASAFHYSAIMLAPIYVIAALTKRTKASFSLAAGLIYILLFLFGDQIALPFVEILISLTGKYDYYQEQGSIATGWGFMFFTLQLIFILYFSGTTDSEAVMMRIAAVNALMIPLGLVNHMAGRYTLYLSPVLIVALPALMMRINSAALKVGFIGANIVFTLISYVVFFKSETYFEFYYNYQTIFSAPKWQ